MIISAASERKSRRSSTGIAAIAAKEIITVRTCIPGSRLANPLIVCERLPPLDFSRYNEPWLLCIMRAYGVFFFFSFFFFSIFLFSHTLDSQGLARKKKHSKALPYVLCIRTRYVRTYDEFSAKFMFVLSLYQTTQTHSATD